MHQCNPFIEYYYTALESLNRSNSEQAEGRENLPQTVRLNPQYRLILEEGADRRRYNLPTAAEFALVIPDEVDSDNRDVILFTKNTDGSISDRFQYIHRGHPAYLPLHYVLFFPFGNPGYRWSLRLNTNSNRVLGNDNEESTEGIEAELSLLDSTTAITYFRDETRRAHQ
ncbi:hypothetical protein FRX31_009716 [Thalictrum thalictroides]|uniref:Uncharacterized protein n=1 Tax=Thalictrum thalictroides TaxID=46969 RepID=A0A7J6WUW1_THATH|nr:hypothetical protein FRX31_009716 [Thalictrum thalictroides]